MPSLKNRIRALLVRYWANAGSLSVAAAMVCCISLEEIWLHAGTYSPYSDYWEHAAVLHALIKDPWHPANPHLASSASSPRFGPITVLNALFARAFGLDAQGGLRLAAVAYTCLFMLGIWQFFREYFQDERAGLYGLLVMLGSWWEAWTFASIYQPKVLLSVACYPWLAALGLTLLGLAFAVRVLRGDSKPAELAPDTPRPLALGVLVTGVAVVLLTHQLTAVMALSALLLLALTLPAVPARRRAWVCGTVAAGCLLASFWPYFSVWQVLSGGHSDAGWVSQGVHAAVTGTLVVERHRFYNLPDLASALGLALVGVLALPYFLLSRRRLFVGLGALSMLLPFGINAFVPLPLGHRFLLLGVFFLQVGVVWLLLTLTPGSAEYPRVLETPWRRRGSLAVVWLVLLIFGLHNVERTRKEWAYFGRYADRGPSIYVRYARAVAQIAGEHAVVLGDALTLWPIPTFGPKVVALKHENPLVPDADERQFTVDRFLAGDTPDDERIALLRRYAVTHVILNRDERGSVTRFLAVYARSDRLPAGYSLYTLSLPAP
ncbi:MAG TPA: hypothetical protein VK745_13670 [Polyangiaceae bacterium]|jgi:hypothetical protein|nr:hypothetical protein [Polyangiaceae bacterium]